MVLFCRRFLLADYSSCHNSEAADEQQSDPQPHHTVIAGLRRLNIVFAGIALAIVVSICVGSLAVLDDNATTCYAFSLVIFLLILF